MNNLKNIVLTIIICCSALALNGCSEGPATEIRVTNYGPDALTNVELRYNDEEFVIGTLPAGSSESVEIRGANDARVDILHDTIPESLGDLWIEIPAIQREGLISVGIEDGVVRRYSFTPK